MPFPFDPATYYDEEMQRLMGGQSPRFPAYKPEEEEGVLRYLGRQVLGGVGFLGNVLDTPGSVVRGLISGDPGRAFGGILDPAQRVHGREMLEGAGLLSPNQEGIDWGDVAGFGVDVLTDPLTYATFGSAALTKTGQAAKKTGQLARTFGDRVAQGQQTLTRFGVPFTDIGVNVGGPEALNAINAVGRGVKTAASYVPGAATVGKAASAVGNAVAPVGRGLKAMFYSPVEGTTSPLMQKTLEGMNLYVRPGAEYQAQKEVYDILGKLEAAGGLKNELGVVDPYEIGNRIRDSLEGLYTPLPGTPLHDAFQSFKALHGGQNASEYALGLNAPRREYYAPHQETLGVRGESRLGGMRGRSPVDAGHVYQLERDPIFGDLPARKINELTSGQIGDLRYKVDAAGNRVPRTALEQAEWVRDNVLYDWENVRGMLGRTDVSALGGEARATALRQAAQPITAKEAVELHQLSQRAGALSPAEEARLAELALKRDTQAVSAAERAQWVDLGQRAGSLSPADQATFDALNARVKNLAELEKHNAILKQSGHLADFVSGLPHLDQKLPFFGNNYFADALQRNVTSAKATTKAQALYDLFKQPGVVLNQAGQDTVPLASAVQGLVDKGNYTSEAHNVLRNALGKTPQEYAQLHVPQEVANDLVRAVHGFTMPDALKPVVNAYDSLLNIFKSTVSSSLLPTNVPRYTRNMLQQVWGMFVGGHHDPRFGAANPLGYARPIQDANAVFRQGKVLADANTIPGLTHLTPEEATKELAKEVAAGNVFGQHRLTADAATMTPGAEHAAQQTLRMPGAKQPSVGEILKGAIPKNAEELKPWNIRGVGDRNVTQFAPAKAGREMDEAIDAATRGASYIALRRQGFDPVAAAAEVNRVHYNYGNLSGFEKAIARRVMPFYGWTRSNIPAQLKLLMEQPGGATAQALRGINLAHEDQGFTPEYVNETLGIPLGGEGENRRFLTTLGLPFEDLKLIQTGKGSLAKNAGRTVERLMGEMSPIIKAPLELATGKQFYSGRDLGDLYGPFGDVGLDQLLMNSPLSRAYTAGRTLLDERKDPLAKLSNLVGPGRITDVNMEKAKDVAARQAVTELLQQQPGVHTFERPYVRPEDYGMLSPEAIALLRLQGTLEKKSKDQARQPQKVGVRRPQ